MAASRAAAVMFFAALIASTSGFTQWEGPQLVSSGMTRWLREWSGGTGGGPGALWGAFLQIEGVLLALGAAGLAIGLRARHPQADTQPPLLSAHALVVFVIWVLWAVLLTARPGRTASTWLVLLPPALLGACVTISRAWALAATSSSRWRLRWAVPAAAAAGFLALHLVGGGVKVARDPHSTPFRPYADTTEPAVRYLAWDVGLWVHQGIGLDVVSSHGVDPVLGWQLRSERDIRWVPAPGARPAQRRYVLTPPGLELPGHQEVTVYPLRQVAGRQHRIAVQARGSW